jgi:hypothetical protein
MDEYALLAAFHISTKFFPGVKTGDVRGLRLLQDDQHHVVQGECELPDYVNWRRKSKAARIILRSGLNIVRAISRTLAICAMNPRVVVPYLPAIFSSTSTFKEVAAYGQSTLARLNVAARAADASRAMLLTSCRKVALLTAIFAFL